MVTLDIAQKFYTIEAYLELEDASPVRHEFNNGEIKEMAGGILPHNVVKLRAAGMLDFMLLRLKLPHVACNSDTKVRLEAFNRFVYPDVAITDGTPEYYLTPNARLRRDIITNPLVIIEVLSEDTRGYDKEEKFEEYATIPTFREYILIEPEKIWVKHMFLPDAATGIWQVKILRERSETLTLQSLDLSISLDDIYSALDKLPA